MDNISEMQFFKIPMVNLENSPIYPSHYINNKIIKKKKFRSHVVVGKTSIPTVRKTWDQTLTPDLPAVWAS